MALCARDVMQSHVITVSPETPLLEVHRLFVEEEIHGAPVVDDAGQVLGVVSSGDLLRSVEEEHEGPDDRSDYLRELLEYSAPDWMQRGAGDLQDRLGRLSAEDVMTRGAISTTPGASVPEVAGLIRKHRIHRVLIVEDDKLLGVLSTFDLVGLLESQERS